MVYPKLSGTEINILYKLYGFGLHMLDFDFDDVPSKEARDSLIQKGYASMAFRSPKKNTEMCLVITPLGVDAYKHGITTGWE